jgi:hypothetical protein
MYVCYLYVYVTYIIPFSYRNSSHILAQVEVLNSKLCRLKDINAIQLTVSTYKEGNEG